jgi:carbamate kinase
MSRIVVALGGNALIRRGEVGSIEVQQANARRAAVALADLEAAGHEIVVTHGNGPQVGYLAIEADAARETVPPPPLDVLVAESQGQIGYVLAAALRTELTRRGRRRPIVAVLTQTIVDRDDPAFLRPSKPVGPMYDETTARSLAAEHGWTVAVDGPGWRRVVPSPAPQAILEAETIRTLVDAGTIVIASGGGGIPVALAPGARGELTGVEAVVDKDLEAVILAEAVDADALLLLTDVDAVRLGWGGPRPIPIRRLAAGAVAAGIANGTFASGSMAPKVAAAAAFAQRTGRIAAIGALDEAPAVLAGRAGTVVVADGLPAAASRGPRARPAPDRVPALAG